MTVLLNGKYCISFPESQNSQRSNRIDSYNIFRSKRDVNRLGHPARRQRRGDQYFQQTSGLFDGLDDQLAEGCRDLRLRFAEHHAELWALLWNWR